mgnify:FL=1
MKKAAFLLALVMLLGLLPGCGQAEGEASVQSVSMICGLGSVGLADRFGGIVSPLGETKIKKDDSLTVDTIKVKVGDTVAVGDVLFTYDLSELQRNLEKAQLELEQQQNQLENKESEKKDLEEQRDQTGDDAARREYTLQIREANLDILTYKANISSKKKDIEKVQNNLKNASVKSEVAGEVQAINENGGSDNNGNPLPFMTIVETGGFRVKGYVNENNAAALREGTEVIIRSRVSDQTWKGSVDTVDWNNPVQQQSYYDSDTSLSSKYPFYVALDEGDGLLLGQHVYIEPDYGQEDEQDASAINLPSYFISDPDGKPWVWAQSSKGKLEKRDLKLGEYNADTDTYPVLEGLTAEDYIAYPDESLKAGMACVTYDDATFDPGTNGGTNGGVDGGMIDGSADVPTDEGGYVDGGQRVDGDDSGVVTMPAVEG